MKLLSISFTDHPEIRKAGIQDLLNKKIPKQVRDDARLDKCS